MSGVPEREQLFARLAVGLPLERPAWRGAGCQAAVLVALSDEQQPRVLLGRRALHLPLHPGEFAFPGGKREASDHGPWDTALREAREEIGWSAELLEPLGELPAAVTRSRFAVHPCVVRVRELPPLQVDRNEFDSVFLLPLALFAEARRYRLERMTVAGATRLVPHYRLEQGIVWGVTARILARLANISLGAGLDLPEASEEST